MQTIKSSASSTTATGKPANRNKSSNTAANGNGNGNGGAGTAGQSTASPNREEIANLAFKLYVESGCQEGRDLENWTQAEQMLRQQGGGQNRLAQRTQENDRQTAGEGSRQQF